MVMEEANLSCTKWTARVRSVTSESGFDIQQPIEVDEKGHPVNSFRQFLVWKKCTIIPTLSGLSIKQKTAFSAPRLFKKNTKEPRISKILPTHLFFRGSWVSFRKTLRWKSPPCRFQDESCSECQEHLEPGLRVFFFKVLDIQKSWKPEQKYDGPWKTNHFLFKLWGSF